MNEVNLQRMVFWVEDVDLSCALAFVILGAETGWVIDSGRCRVDAFTRN